MTSTPELGEAGLAMLVAGLTDRDFLVEDDFEAALHATFAGLDFTAAKKKKKIETAWDVSGLNASLAQIGTFG